MFFVITAKQDRFIINRNNVSKIKRPSFFNLTTYKNECIYMHIDQHIYLSNVYRRICGVDEIFISTKCLYRRNIYIDEIVIVLMNIDENAKSTK